MPSRASSQGDAEATVDPEFLALTERQRARIDGAFDRGLDGIAGRKRKRPKTISVPTKAPKTKSDEVGGGGGFEEDGDGGFVLDEDEAGGFMDEEDGGGFLPDAASPLPQELPTTNTSSISSPAPREGRVPVRLIPTLLQSLGLPFDDDVLNVFKASALGWDEDDDEGDSRSRRKAGDGEAGVERKDFRAVCAALMGDEDDNGANIDMLGDQDGFQEVVDEEAAGGGFLGSDNDEDDEDVYEDEESSLSSLSSDSEFGASRPKRAAARKRKGKARTAETDSDVGSRKRRKTKKDVLRETGPIKLSGRQREVVQDIWNMLKPPSNASGRNRSGNILGRDEVKAWTRSLGEMWTEEEITEMVTLFSSQHEQRGLSFDDFGAIMVRAGLA